MLRTKDRGVTFEEISGDLTKNEQDKQGLNGGPITAENVRSALGAFERELVTRSRWDDYLDGELPENLEALTERLRELFAERAPGARRRRADPRLPPGSAPPGWPG